MNCGLQYKNILNIWFIWISILNLDDWKKCYRDVKCGIKPFDIQPSKMKLVVDTCDRRTRCRLVIARQITIIITLKIGIQRLHQNIYFWRYQVLRYSRWKNWIHMGSVSVFNVVIVVTIVVTVISIVIFVTDFKNILERESLMWAPL